MPDESTAFHSRWSFGQRVYIDSDRDLKGVVTGLCWKDSDGHTVEVSWMHNGISQAAWIQSWRLSDAQ